jgi:hypothetical protein
MFGAAAPYLVSIFAMLFSALSAFTLAHVATHFDPPSPAPPPPTAEPDVQAQV